MACWSEKNMIQQRACGDKRLWQIRLTPQRLETILILLFAPFNPNRGKSLQNFSI